MIYGRVKLTPDVPTHRVCHVCNRRSTYCHCDCVDYAIELVVSACAMTGAHRRKQLANDIIESDRARIKRGIYE